jgi:hypothetical protein
MAIRTLPTLLGSYSSNHTSRKLRLKVKYRNEFLIYKILLL